MRRFRVIDLSNLSSAKHRFGVYDLDSDAIICTGALRADLARVAVMLNYSPDVQATVFPPRRDGDAAADAKSKSAGR